jgi:ribosomal protein S18 acetylase RimI-like enzyme
MGTPSWELRQARPEDRDFLFDLNRATMKEYVERVWGWDESGQITFFDDRFAPDQWQIIQADGTDIGVLIVQEDARQIHVAEIQILPEWQGRGIGSSVVRELMDRGTATGRSLTLRVLHANPRARALYERFGFRAFKSIETHTYLRWP